MKHIVRVIITTLYGAMILVLFATMVMALRDHRAVYQMLAMTVLVLTMRVIWKGIVLWD